MKKYLILASAAILALAACQKQNEINVPAEDDAVVLTFTSERPQMDVDTRTAWDATNSCIVWETTDKIRVGYTLNGNWMGKDSAGDAKFFASEEVTITSSDESLGTFTVPVGSSSFTDTDPENSREYKFYAIYPKDILTNTTVSDPTNHSIILATTQNPGANTFDHGADIMVGASAAITSKGLPTDPIEIDWNRVVAHAALTFSNMAFSGTETPNKITLTFNEGAKVAGSFSVNITDGTIGEGSSNEIILEGSGLSVSGSSIVAWATVLPVSFTSLNVEIKTDKATYTRSITGISGKTFKKNARNTLTIDMATASRTASAQYDWVKKNLSEITSSDVFVIVGNNGSGNYAMTNGASTQNPPSAVSVTISNNKLSSVPADNIQWNLSVDNGNYTFYPNGSTSIWLYCTNTNNGVRVGDNANNLFTLKNGYLYHSYTSRYVGLYTANGASAPQDWRCYSSTTGNIAGQTFSFYVRASATPSKPVPTISFGSPTTEVNIGETVTNVATIDPSTLSVTYSSSDESIATVDNAGVVTGVAAGTVTITAAFAGNDSYDSASANYDITVVDPNVNDGSLAHPYTVAEAKAAYDANSSIGSKYVKGIVSTAGFASSGKVCCYISDDGTTATQFELYNITSGETISDLKLGDFIVAHGTITKYNSTYEISGCTVDVEVNAPTFTPAGGNFSGASQSVTLIADSDAEIRYTTDGTNPTVSTGTVYSAPISVSSTTTIKAIAVKDGFATGVVSSTYTKVSSGSKTVQYVFNTEAGIAALGITKPANNAGTALGDDTYTVGAVSMTATTAEGKTETRVWCTSGGVLDLRIYVGGTFTFTTSTGSIKSIVLSGGTVGGFTANVGSFSSGTWSGSASSVVLTATGTEKINTISVTYE